MINRTANEKLGTFIVPSSTEVVEINALFQNIPWLGLELVKPSKRDISDTVYQSLLSITEKPANISTARFEKILKIKANIFNIFINGKIQIDEILLILEKECAENFCLYDLSGKRISEWNLNSLQPKKYICDKNEYFPFISPEILNVVCPTEVLTNVLNRQFHKNNVNLPIAGTAKDFVKSEGWYCFFKLIPFRKALSYLEKGVVFVDPVEFPDGDSRTHGGYSHAIQEYLISKLIEIGHVNDLCVENENDITERELLQADGWRVSTPHNRIKSLFDVFKERQKGKLELLNLSKELSVNFTSPNIINEYLMLNPSKFPVLSVIIYNQYAQSYLAFFKQGEINNVFLEKKAEFIRVDNSIVKFDDLTTDEKINVMNKYFDHIYLSPDVVNFFNENADFCIVENTSVSVWEKGPGEDFDEGPDVLTVKESRVGLKLAKQSIFQFTQTYDDGNALMRSMKKLMPR